MNEESRPFVRQSSSRLRLSLLPAHREVCGLQLLGVTIVEPRAGHSFSSRIAAFLRPTSPNFGSRCSRLGLLGRFRSYDVGAT